MGLAELLYVLALKITNKKKTMTTAKSMLVGGLYKANHVFDMMHGSNGASLRAGVTVEYFQSTSGTEQQQHLSLNTRIKKKKKRICCFRLSNCDSKPKGSNTI